MDMVDILMAKQLAGGSGGGGGGGVLVATDNEGVLDKTWQEIVDAPFAVVKTPNPYPLGGASVSPICIYGVFDGAYGVHASKPTGGQTKAYYCETPNDYPVAD